VHEQDRLAAAEIEVFQRRAVDGLDAHRRHVEALTAMAQATRDDSPACSHAVCIVARYLSSKQLDL
jgi:hypothetical protein